MAEPIEGKVAKILDDQSLILNVGQAHGVTQGMVFCIYATVEDVTDPDSGESLGAWEAVKGYVQATHPQEGLTVCRAYAPRAAESAKPEDRQAQLNVNRTQLSGMPQLEPISVGDPARSVAEGDLPT
jgi:hypothetical protein